VRIVLRWFLSRSLVRALLKHEMPIDVDDWRWTTPLERAGAPSRWEAAPPDQSPERFAAHFQRCRCPFWQWFRSLQLIGSTKRVLEVGTGPGHIVHHFAAAGFDVLSVTPGELARRDRECRGIEAVRGDMHFIAERGASFDLIVAGYALERSRSPLFALWEWQRLLRPDGHLLVLAHLPVDQPPADDGGEPKPRAYPNSAVRPPLFLLTYWQLRWLFRQAQFQLIAETLEDPERRALESTAHVDGRRPPGPARPWNAYFIVRKPGRLPYEVELEKPRPIAWKAKATPPDGEPTY
jgi:SAM-dependent methyltransferase